ncbi:hypothetical protein M707_24305 [Arthrobacter sp. AK-YN10]|nr:hypothetical protein M707_24305 [Arthrobacter sp. AK-YN10]
MKEAGSSGGDAADDCVLKHGIAAQYDAGNREAGGQEARDGEEHVETDACTEQRPMLPRVVLKGTHAAVGVQAGQDEGEECAGLPGQAVPGPFAFAPVLTLVEKFEP